jgi:hypothetical protein
VRKLEKEFIYIYKETYKALLLPLFSESNIEELEKEIMYNSSILLLNENADSERLDKIWNYIHQKDDLTYRIFLLHI